MMRHRQTGDTNAHTNRIRGTSLATALLAVLALPVLADAGFALDDIPQIKNKRPIHVAIEAGGGADLIIPYLQKFAKATGVPVTSESMVFATIYSKEVIELQGRTGAYDVVVTETSWTNESTKSHKNTTPKAKPGSTRSL